MKYRDIKKAIDALEKIKNIKNKKLALAIIKNKEILNNELKNIEKIKNDVHPDYVHFENKRILLCETYCERDENNKPIIETINGVSSFKIKDMETFSEKYKELLKEYDYVIKDMERNKIEFEKFLDEEADIELKTVSIDDLPDDIDAETLENIMFMISQ